MEEKVMEIMRRIVGSGESVYRIDLDYDYAYVIGPQTADHEKPDLDLAWCIEETLHRILEIGEDPFYIIGAQLPDEELARRLDEEDPDDLYEIDLGYVIPDFHPWRVHWLEDYEEPVCRYTVREEDGKVLDTIVVPESMSDEDVLEKVCDRAGMKQEESVISDLNGDASIYMIQDLVTGRCLRLDRQ